MTFKISSKPAASSSGVLLEPGPATSPLCASVRADERLLPSVPESVAERERERDAGCLHAQSV